MRSVCDTAPDLLPLEEAKRRLFSVMAPVTEVETIPAALAQGRVLAEDLKTPLDFPPFSNAAMDGYAVKAQEAIPGARLRKIESVFAGSPSRQALKAGSCIRIFTGAPMPEGADAVVVQERVSVLGNDIQLDIEQPLRPGANVRYQGEELAVGDVLLKQGVLIGPYELGLMAYAGIIEIAVRKRLRVGVLATGDELLPPEQILAPGKIHESNRPVLLGLIRDMGHEPIDLGTVPDDLSALIEVLQLARPGLDAILTTGGASEGDADFVAKALGMMGSVSFWKVAVKPGKPFLFGYLGEVPVFGLPGNPVSSAIIFLKLVKPSLEMLSGLGPRRAIVFRLPLLAGLRRQPGRLEYMRGRLVETEAGLEVEALPEQGSHRLTSLHQGDCLIVVPAEAREFQKGDLVSVEFFRPVSFSEALP
jgi:molybdopterin molybdotransferase